LRAIVFLLLSSPGVSLAQQVAFQRYSVSPPFTSSLDAITTGPDGALWTNDPITGQINRVTVAGAVSSFQVATCEPPFGCGLAGITGGPDGAVWFTNWSHGTISRITPAGVVTNVYHVPGRGAPWGITTGPDGALWFCAQYPKDNEIGRVTTTGVFTMYPVPHPVTPSSQPQSITTGPDGALWFSGNQIGSAYVGRITTTGAITVYPVTIAGEQSTTYLAGITTGPDGALWFGDGSAIGRITTSGLISYYPISSNVPISVTSIAAGPDGNLWFSETAGADVYRMTTSGTVSEYFPSFTTYYGAFGVMITAGPGGTLWFSDGNTMGEIVFLTATLNVSPSGGYYGTSLTFTGSGFASGETVNIYSAGVGSPVIASVVANSSGSITAQGSTPPSASGERLFLGLGQTSGKLGAPYFNTGASVIATPDSGPPGTSVKVEAYGFWSLQPLSINFNGSPVGNLTSNLRGFFSGDSALTFMVPEGTSPGTYTITASGPYDYLASASASFTVQ